jgi:hypothetical protein
MPARHRQFSSHASDRHRSWSVTPGIWPAVTLAYAAWQDGGSGHAAKPVPPPPPLPLTLLPCAASFATPLHGGMPDPKQRQCSRPPWLSMTGTARGGGEGEDTPEGRGGGGGGSHAGEEGLRCTPPPASLLQCSNSCRGGAGVTLETTDNKQMTIKVDKGWLSTRGSQFCAPTPPPKKTQSAIGIGGSGWQDLIWCRKEGPGMQLS